MDYKACGWMDYTMDGWITKIKWVDENMDGLHNGWVDYKDCEWIDEYMDEVDGLHNGWVDYKDEYMDNVGEWIIKIVGG